MMPLSTSLNPKTNMTFSIVHWGKSYLPDAANRGVTYVSKWVYLLYLYHNITEYQEISRIGNEIMLAVAIKFEIFP